MMLPYLKTERLDRLIEFYHVLVVYNGFINIYFYYKAIYYIVVKVLLKTSSNTHLFLNSNPQISVSLLLCEKITSKYQKK